MKRGTKVYRKNQDSDDTYTVGIVHKVIRENGVITKVQVSFWRKDRTGGCKNRTMYIENLTFEPINT
jgi:hypothetical protein